MKFGSLCVFALALVAIPALSQETKRPIEIGDFFRIKSVGGPRISPDEKWIAYTLRENDLKEDKAETRIRMIPRAGGEAIPMTAKGYSAANPRFSPDGKYLSFSSNHGKGKTQVWGLNRLGGEAVQLTKVVQGISGYSWSPDAKRLLLTIRDPKPHELTKDKKDDKLPRPHVINRLQFKRDNAGYLDRYRRHLYVYTLESGAEPTQITSGDFDDSQAVWSPDGKSIAFVSNRSKNPDGNPNTDIWIVSADNTDKGATLLHVTTNPREDSSPAWSPDGKWLVYTSITEPLKTLWYATNQLTLISATGGKPKFLAPQLDRNVGRPKFSSDGKTIYFGLEDSGERQLASIPVQGGALTKHVAGKRVVRGFAIKGKTIATLIRTPTRPNEIYTLAHGTATQITEANTELFGRIQLSTVENIHFKSKDGTVIEGFVYKPAGFNKAMKYPTLLRNHGGPVSQYDFGFRFDPQLFAAHGYVVLEVNPRGSSGYGQAFSQVLFADWGHKDVEDVLAGVDYLIDRGVADADKLGVGGWSYGGILTNYVITQTTRFKGAISGASEALYRANYGHDHYQMWWEVELGLPWENPQAWERISPFNKVAKITTPTLWMGGAVDWNVPILNSEQMYQAMKRLGRDTQLVVYPGEHHGIRRLSFQKDRLERYLAWYDKHVKGIDPKSEQ